MSRKIFITCVFLLMLALGASAQRIVVDTATTSKYLIKKSESSEVAKEEAPAPTASSEDLSFGERALSIGKGIMNRLKARLNLEEAAESIKDKKEKLLKGKEEEQTDAQNKEEGDT